VQISKELIAPARITAPAHWSIPRVTLRNIWRLYYKTGENPRIVTISYNCQLLRIIKNCYILRIVKNCYEMLRIVTKNQLLRIVTKCYELLQNVKNCNNSTFVLQYACTIENDSHYQ
jgi:hypothetical protein